jgi:hypothetical protein
MRARAREVKPLRYLLETNTNLKKDSILVSIPDIENKEIELQSYDKELKTEGYLLLVNSSSSQNEKLDSSDSDSSKGKESNSLIITNDKLFAFSNEPPPPKHMKKFIFSPEVYCEICRKV